MTTEAHIQPLLNERTFFCPLCNRSHALSGYLKTVFAANPQALWLANMVTHYRHNHIQSWNKCWGPYGNYYRGRWFNDYAQQKQLVNERAKRQIIRKAASYLQYHGITVATFDALQYNDSKTLEIAQQKLS